MLFGCPRFEADLIPPMGSERTKLLEPHTLPLWGQDPREPRTGPPGPWCCSRWEPAHKCVRGCGPNPVCRRCGGGHRPGACGVLSGTVSVGPGLVRCGVREEGVSGVKVCVVGAGG